MDFAEYKRRYDALTRNVHEAHARFVVACNGYNQATRAAAWDEYLHALAWRDQCDKENAVAFRSTQDA